MICFGQKTTHRFFGICYKDMYNMKMLQILQENYKIFRPSDLPGMLLLLFIIIEYLLLRLYCHN